MCSHVKLFDWFRSVSCSIVADPGDNSISFNERLFHHIKKHAEGNSAKFFVFSIPAKHTYGFLLDPEFKEETVLCDLQYNDKYNSVGFETLCPTVNKIFYDFNLPSDKKVQLSVRIKRLKQGDKEKFYYQIRRPHDNLIKKYSKK